MNFSMAFGDPLQWIIIGVVVVVIFLWGPGKIPELARALGSARKEFDQASKDFNSVVEGKLPPTVLGAPQPQAQVPEKTGDQVLIETARALGISTEGKTRDQISQEIVKATKPAPAPAPTS